MLIQVILQMTPTIKRHAREYGEKELPNAIEYRFYFE